MKKKISRIVEFIGLLCFTLVKHNNTNQKKGRNNMKSKGLKIALITWIIVVLIRKIVELNIIYEAIIWFAIYFVLSKLADKLMESKMIK